MNEMRMIKRMLPVAYCLGCILLTLGSCGEGAECVTGSEPPAVSEVPLQVSASLEDAPAGTRAAVPLQPDGGAIHVIRSNANGYTSCDKEYIYTTAENGSGSWALPDGELPVYIDSRDAKLRAYYDPHGLIDDTGTNATLTAQPYDDSKLLYYCTSAATSPIDCFNPNARFVLKMPYTRLKLTLKRHESNYENGECRITAISLSYKSGSVSTFCTGKKLDISNGQLTTTVTAAAYNQDLDIDPLSPGATDTDTYDVLLPPQSVGSGLTITLTIDGIRRAVTLPAAQLGNLAAGRQYTVSLLILDTIYVTMTGNVWIDEFGNTIDFPFNGETID